jgi:xanthine dehydrogenase accessory factor
VLHALLEAFDAAVSRGNSCALATIVSVEGSSYRRPGTRMLIASDGTCTGSISPGCLERDVVEHAQRVIRTHQPALLEYETSSMAHEVAWGLGIGCGGTLRLLVEPLPPDSSYVAALRLACDDRRNVNGVRVTTVFDEFSATHEVSPLPFSNGASAGSVNGSTFEMMPGVLVETLLPRVPLIVFGAGPDAVPLVELARRLDWHVEVVDPQARISSHARFAIANRVTLARPAGVSEHVAIGPRTMAVVMSHDYSHDCALLGFLLATPARYIGVVGPSRRTQQMLNDLATTHEMLDRDVPSIARLYAPAGLDIGADSPEEIALAILAEMRAVAGGRSGGNLRDRGGGIHGMTQMECTAAASAP